MRSLEKGGKKIYAPAGVEVDVISWHHFPVLLCQYKNEKFPVHILKIRKDEIANTTS